MPLFIQNTSTNDRHGAFAQPIPPPATLVAPGTGQACFVEQFPWGPANSLYEPSSNADLLNTTGPKGFTLTGAGHMALINKAWPLPPKFVRVLGSANVTGTATITSSTPTNIMTAAVKYPGAAGNSIVYTTQAASDGDANHFNLTAQITGPSGTTTETVRNINISGTGADNIPSTAGYILIGALTKLASGVPILGNWTVTAGADGSITDTQYTGTPGASDYGFALLENDDDIDFFCTPSKTNNTVNAAAQAHADLKGNRMALINGPSGQSASAAKTDVAQYRDDNVAYFAPYVNTADDTDGTIRLVSPASWGMSLLCQVSPSTSASWKDPSVIEIWTRIASLEMNYGSSIGGMTKAGISVLIGARNGGYALEASVTTNVTSGHELVTRTRMGIYIAEAFQDAVQPYVDAPNVEVLQQEIVGQLESFLDDLKRASKSRSVAVTPHILDFSIGDISSVNTSNTLQQGQFIIPLSVKTSAGMAQIYLQITYGPTVTVTSVNP